MFKVEKNPILNYSIFFIAFVLFFYILYILSNFFIPLIIAILFSFAIIWLSNFYKIFVKWNFVSYTLSLITYWIIFWLIWKMMRANIEELIIIIPEYQYKITSLLNNIFDFFKLTPPTSVNQIIGKIDLQYIFSSIASWVTSVVSSAGLIFFYVMFFLLEYRYFKEKLKLMFYWNSKNKEIIDIIEKIKIDIKSYFFIKTVVSFITALLSYFFIKIVWLDLAIFWAFLIFVLNYIPNIWSVIAVFFPVMLSLIQFDTYFNFIFLLCSLTWVQMLMWNIIEPKFQWNKLNLSPLVIIISLWFWWIIWWIIWMLLSVPIMSIISIILAKIPATRPIAILLSEKWEIDVWNWKEIFKIKKNIIGVVRGIFRRR